MGKGMNTTASVFVQSLGLSERKKREKEIEREREREREVRSRDIAAITKTELIYMCLQSFVLYLTLVLRVILQNREEMHFYYWMI